MRMPINMYAWIPREVGIDCWSGGMIHQNPRGALRALVPRSPGRCGAQISPVGRRSPQPSKNRVSLKEWAHSFAKTKYSKSSSALDFSPVSYHSEIHGLHHSKFPWIGQFCPTNDPWDPDIDAKLRVHLTSHQIVRSSFGEITDVGVDLFSHFPFPKAQILYFSTPGISSSFVRARSDASWSIVLAGATQADTRISSTTSASPKNCVTVCAESNATYALEDQRRTCASALWPYSTHTRYRSMGLTIDLSAGGGLRGYSDEELGTPDGRLSFKRKLGQGAEGSVYLAVRRPHAQASTHPKRRRDGPTNCIQDESQRQLSMRHESSPVRTAHGVGRLPVAVKVVTGDAYRRCRETQCLWPSLRHPNIVFPRKCVFDNENQRCFLEMEYCEIDLLDMVKRDGPLSEARAALFACHLASALAHCHSLGIAHQDVKLENIFMRNGVAKLGDLGSIRRISPTIPPHQESSPAQGHRCNGAPPSSDSVLPSDRHLFEDLLAARSAASNSSCAAASPSPFAGSLMYAPPEAFKARAEAGRGPDAGDAGLGSSGAAAEQRDAFAGDIWCLGVVLYSAVAGHPLPWEIACVQRCVEFQRFVEGGAEVFFPSSFSPGFKSMLSRMLSVDQAKRPTAIDLRNDPWVTSIPATPASRSSSSASRLAGTKRTWPTTNTTPTPPAEALSAATVSHPAPVTPANTTRVNVGDGGHATGASTSDLDASPIPLILKVPTTSLLLHKPIASRRGGGGLGGANKRARFSNAANETAVSVTAGRSAVQIGETLDFGNVSTDNENESNSPLEDFSLSPVLRLPELESQHIIGGGGGGLQQQARAAAVNGRDNSGGVMRYFSGFQRGALGNNEDIARVTPSPSPRTAIPEWRLMSADHGSGGSDYYCELPEFVTVNPVRMSGMKRPVPTARHGGGPGGKDTGESEGAFQTCRRSGPGGRSAVNSARISFKLSECGEREVPRCA